MILNDQSIEYVNDMVARTNAIGARQYELQLAIIVGQAVRDVATMFGVDAVIDRLQGLLDGLPEREEDLTALHDAYLLTRDMSKTLKALPGEVEVL